VAKLTYPFDQNRVAAKIINDKEKTIAFSKHIGVRSPDSLCFQADKANQKLLKNFLSKHKKIIVKPSNGFQGRGLTINIETIEDLNHAIKTASLIGENIIAQEQCYGEELRFITLDSKVKYVMLRKKPAIVGDGSSSVKSLIQKEDSDRQNIKDSLVPYPLLSDILPDNTIYMNMIPNIGERVELGQGSLIRTGASIYNIIDSVDTSYINIAEKISGYFGDGVLSVDLMINDYKSPANSENYVLIEMNNSISLPMCYSCRDGKHISIIEDYIGPRLLESLIK
jgi:D-alanine-D-alanine ligase-like ATP-grasp enzyme